MEFAFYLYLTVLLTVGSVASVLTLIAIKQIRSRLNSWHEANEIAKAIYAEPVTRPEVTKATAGLTVLANQLAQKNRERSQILHVNGK